ncbi:MAG: hypothetical protein A3K65_03870 [Euryarchaeota archaeon RBG_16_68_12]|nr:MAG: hypothetical protein A3K65_03870 [Euryarchaeota archaeon RBG_16_68_12]
MLYVPLSSTGLTQKADLGFIIATTNSSARLAFPSGPGLGIGLLPSEQLRQREIAHGGFVLLQEPVESGLEFHGLPAWLPLPVRVFVGS